MQLVTALAKGSSGPVVWAGDKPSCDVVMAASTLCSTPPRWCLVFVLGLQLVLTSDGRRLVGPRTPVIALNEVNRLRCSFVRGRGRARHAPSCQPV